MSRAGFFCRVARTRMVRERADPPLADLTPGGETATGGVRAAGKSL